MALMQRCHTKGRECGPRMPPHATGRLSRPVLISSIDHNCTQQRIARRTCSKSSKSRSRTVCAVAYADTIAAEAYCCVGLAHCFEKNAEGKLVERMVIEPISPSSLECMANGARTSFKVVTGVRFSDALGRSIDALPAEFAGASFCDKWTARLEAAARTWQRPYAQENLMDIVPLGVVRGAFNFNLEDKRVLNSDNIVSDADNIKQDMSIDVYGRKDEQEAADKAAAAKAAATQPCETMQAAAAAEEDDLDALLAA